VSLDPPRTCHIRVDYVVKEPTVNLFTVPNSLTELSSSSLIGRFVRSSLFVHDKVRASSCTLVPACSG
jgi:hypothetical protein